MIVLWEVVKALKVLRASGITLEGNRKQGPVRFLRLPC